MPRPRTARGYRIKDQLVDDRLSSGEAGCTF
jgi:hypothetical protein